MFPISFPRDVVLIELLFLESASLSIQVGARDGGNKGIVSGKERGGKGRDRRKEPKGSSLVLDLYRGGARRVINAEVTFVSANFQHFYIILTRFIPEITN